MMDFVISCIGVLIFTGLTAYDTQKLRVFGMNAPVDDATAMRRGALLGALELYLDFINLFLMLLRACSAATATSGKGFFQQGKGSLFPGWRCPQGVRARWARPAAAFAGCRR